MGDLLTFSPLVYFRYDPALLVFVDISLSANTRGVMTVAISTAVNRGFDNQFAIDYYAVCFSLNDACSKLFVQS